MVKIMVISAGNIFVPHTKIEYQKLVAILDEVIDIVREDESHL